MYTQVPLDELGEDQSLDEIYFVFCEISDLKWENGARKYENYISLTYFNLCID